MNRVAIDGFCPECGSRSLGIEVRSIRGSTWTIECFHPDCPKPLTAGELLMDSEIEHVVRFDEHGYFNVKHPLRERVGSELLDCQIHGVVDEWVDPLSFAEHNRLKNTTWRIWWQKGELDVADGTWVKEPVL